MSLPTVAPKTDGAASAAGEEAPPLGPLPKDVRPLASTLDLNVDPDAQRFGGSVEIDVELTAARRTIWMHGRGLAITSVTVMPAGQAPIPATFEQVDESGVAALRVPTPVGPGKARLRFEYDAPFATGAQGLHKTREARCSTPWARRRTPHSPSGRGR